MSCQEEEKKKSKPRHPWFHPCVQAVVRDSKLFDVFARNSGLRVKDVLTYNVYKYVSQSSRNCMGHVLYPHANYSMTVVGLVDWLIITYPGPEEEEDEC